MTRACRLTLAYRAFCSTTAGYAALNLIRYFTCGPQEVRAWTVQKGIKAPAAAGVIHSDFEQKVSRV